MLVAPLVPGVEAAGLDRQLARGVARSNLQAAVVRAEDAANGSQSPHLLHGKADLAALTVDTPDPGIANLQSLSQFHIATADLFPDASVTLDDAVAERDRVATRFTWRASQGPGITLVAQGGAIVRFADGRIAECWNLPSELEAVAAEHAIV